MYVCKRWVMVGIRKVLIISLLISLLKLELNVFRLIYFHKSSIYLL